MTHARRRTLASSLITALALAALLGLGSGCAANAPAYQREHLVDRIMSFDADASGRAFPCFERLHLAGAGACVGGAGGGCACK